MQPHGQSYWDHADKESRDRYVPIDRGCMELYRGIWVYYTYQGAWSHAIDVMGKRCGFQGTSKASVYTQLDAWIDGKPIPVERRTARPHTRSALPIEERVKYILLPKKPIKVSDQYAYQNDHRGKFHVTVGVSIDGHKKTVFGGYFDDWDEAKAASIRTCRAINNEIERRRK